MFLSTHLPITFPSFTERAARRQVVPCLLYVAVNRFGLPERRGNSGWVLSSAWIWLFSSTQRTKAFSGGLRYNPRIAACFSSNSGSGLLPHQYSILWGFKLTCVRIRWTVVFPIPVALASVRIVQRLPPSTDFVHASMVIRVFTSGSHYPQTILNRRKTF